MADKKKQYKKKTDRVTKVDTFTKEEVLKAIEGSGGVVTTIAGKLGVFRSTAERIIDMYEETKQAFIDEKKKMNDMAKTTILTSIRNGDTASSKWWLSKQDKEEGFGDEAPIVNVNNMPAQTDNIKQNLDKLTPEERDLYFELCEKITENNDSISN